MRKKLMASLPKPIPSLRVSFISHYLRSRLDLHHFTGQSIAVIPWKFKPAPGLLPHFIRGYTNHRIEPMENDLKRVSKFLSLVLRHQPEKIGLQLDRNGWVSVDALAAASGISLEVISAVVASNDKQRFSFSPDGKLIRANQGHSVQNVDLELSPVAPPNMLFHGTVARYLESIKKDGLQRMSRQHVHLSESVDTAQAVGARRGVPIVLEVDSKLMQEEDYIFFRSTNGVWLTDRVPPQFLRQMSV